MKTIVALQTSSTQSKSELFKSLLDSLKGYYGFEYVQKDSERRTKEVVTTIKIGNQVIGITSYGTNLKILQPALEKFHLGDCNIIICVCGSNQSGSYSFINSFSDRRYEIKFVNEAQSLQTTKRELGNRIYTALNSNVNSWATQWIAQNVLVKNSEVTEHFYHINTPAKIHFPQDIIAEFNSEYLPNEEKGGFILFLPKYSNGNLQLVAKKIIWIPNVAEDKRGSYRIRTPMHNTCQLQAFSDGYLPLQFHTHPEPGGDIVYRSLVLIKNLNTSDADKRISKSAYGTGIFDVLIPDILVVGDVNNKNQLFVGAYNGFVTPVDFERHQQKLAANNLASIGNHISDWMDTPGKKLGATIAAVTVGALAIFNPRVSLPVMATLGAQFPVISMIDNGKSQYFGITGERAFTIHIPALTEELKKENREALGRINRG